ncbi:MAG: hypothetical protein HPY66_0159 [Firmicutes bacterium]|nr:hypothetical protein [Bacillota bacterium]
MSMGMFLVISLVAPWLSGLTMWGLFRNNPKKSGILSTLVSSGILLSALSLFQRVYSGNASYEVHGFFTGSILLSVTPVGYAFIILTSLVWLAASVFSIVYMQKSHYQGRFYLFFMITLGSTLGVFVSGDMIAFFTFFEIMSLASFMLVIHEQDRDALEAGKLYIFMSIFGSLMALMGLFMIYHHTGTLRIDELHGVLKTMGVSGYVAYFLITLGLGVKAGIVPFHVWLPKAHPVAPSPASAVLSGILLKTGIYGIFLASYVLLGVDASIGKVVAVLGAVTMIMGAGCAVKSRNFKVLLAYSSMSQMGYVVLALGTAAALEDAGLLGYTGGIYQAINHGLYEAMLFLIAGYVYLIRGTIDFNGLSGIIRKDRIAGVFLLTGLAAISGLPGLNGFIGKTLIHDALLEAYHNSHHLLFWGLEKAFILGSSLTSAYCFRIADAMRGGEENKEQDLPGITGARTLVYASFALLTGGIVYTGLFSDSVVSLLKPGLQSLHGHMPDIYSASALLSPIKAYIIGFVLYMIARSGLEGKIERRSKEVDIFERISQTVLHMTGKKLFDEKSVKKPYVLFMHRIRSSTSIIHRLYDLIKVAMMTVVRIIGAFFVVMDRGFSFESNIYNPVIKGVYRFLSRLFGCVDKGVDFFYTFFTSFLTGIYHRDEEENEDENKETLIIRERAVLYKKYRIIVREIAHGHFLEAGRMVRGYFREKEYSMSNLNVGVIIFAAMVVVFMLIFVMYVPMLSNGAAVF